jgi:tRNA threonylcarbamoyladenosine biosynthesis protein TsaB
MKSLIIDTSHDISYIILIKNKKIIFFKKIDKIKLSKELVQNLDYILKETKTDLSKLKYIASSIGPGSFTGLRVGASVCKTLSFAKKIPLIGYVSLKAYVPSKDSKFLSVFDAKSEGIYSLEGQKTQDEIKYASQPKLVSFNDSKKLFENFSLIISPDAEKLKEKFTEYADKFENAPFDPNRLINVTENLYQQEKAKNAHSLNLLYLRGPNHVE